MKKFDYVISACNMMGLNTRHYFENEKKISILNTCLKKSMNIINQSISNNCRHNENSVSILFNAFTEAGFLDDFKALNKLSADLLYADSGGLQMVTAGRTITEELKDDIYKIQCDADRAMCFDVIPLESVSLTRTKNERSNISNKVFISERHKESGRLTGNNILRQCEIFDKNNSPAKVMVIVQGNRTDDMLMFFDEIQKQIPESLIHHIGGIAVADTCMGNGELESIEMLKAAHIISKNSHSNYGSHLHMLGVGSLSRMKPAAYLSKAGFLDTFERISYDSTSHTSSLIFGKFFDAGRNESIGLHRTMFSEEKLSKIYKLFEPLLKDICTEEKFVDSAFDPATNEFKKTSLVNRAKGDDMKNYATCAMIPILYVYYQVHEFIIQLDKIFENINDDQTAIGKLQYCKDLSSLDDWFANLSRYIETKRITRKEEFNSLQGFFE